ncbi:MAG: NHLP family bacteriocin export ABC transporter peptidase/permease/ATPase subunit [Acidobacteriota bacterium]
MRRTRIKTPPLLQLEAVECGAAALGIILRYYKRVLPLEELRAACGVSRDGSRASNVVKAARTYGLTAKGLKKDIDTLHKVRLPAIVFWNFNHFVVLEGFGKNRYYLNDPAMGHRHVTAAEFNESYTGVVLVFEKTPAFRKGGKEPSVVRALAERMRGNWLGFSYLLLVTLGLVVPGLVSPAFARIFIDNVLIGGMESWVRPLIVVMLATALLIGLFNALEQHILLRLQTRLSLTSSARFMWHVLRLPVEFFAQRSAAEIGERTGMNDRVASLLAGQLAPSAVSILLVGFYAALMFHYDVLLTAIGIAVALVNIVALRLISSGLKDDTMRLLQEHGKLMGVSVSGLQAIETLKSTGAESDFFSRWAGYHAKAANSMQRIAGRSMLLSLIPTVLVGLLGAAVLGVGGLRVMEGVLTMGMFITFQGLLGSFMSPVSQVMNLGATMQQMTGDITRLDDVLRNPVALLAGLDENCTGARLAGHLELRNITFGYSRLEEPLIRNFSLSLRPGERVAIVGSSGSGKSTLAKVVSGLFEPWSGEILFDGVPRASLARSLVVSSLSMVDQDICLFEGSIRDNITLWDNGVPLTTVVEAAKDAAIHDDIVSRAGGYDALVEESARNFSGGQRQRIEIARALVSNPRILILDEGTSALDPQTEKLIEDGIRRRGCTCLVVAHRLSAIRDCDEIIVLEKGQVAERGTHEQMMRANGPYASLIEST